jgi:GH15 family glucan-1,4-alpha-glucosidase
MSEIQTNNWLNKSEQDVISSLGNYKRKEKIDSGYKISFDYSSYRVPNNKIYTKSYNISNTNIVDKKGNLLVQRTDAMPNNNMQNYNTQLEVINLKYLEFYFDKNRKVSYVLASGYPDSIRYELRKKIK